METLDFILAVKLCFLFLWRGKNYARLIREEL